jgi:glycosyltransferase involved in cell wall biosynthesis
MLATRTAGRGYRSEVWIRPSGALDPFASEIAASGIPVRRLTVEGKGDLTGLLRLSRSLGALRPEILHVHLASPVESLPVLLAAGKGGARIVTTEHAPTHHPAQRPWSRAAKRRASRRIARVIVLTNSDAAYLRDEFHVQEAKIRVIANGVDPDPDLPPRSEARRRLGIAEGAPVLGYVGEIVEKKGLPELVEAVRLIVGRGGPSADPDDRAMPVTVLAGEGPFRADLERLVAHHGLGRRVLLPGPLHPPDALYAACDIFVLPSRGEAMPLALLEAMAAGLPVVATEVGGIPEVVRSGQEGWVTPVRDPRALSEAIGRLIGDPSSRERMGRSARQRVREAYSVDRMVEATCALYDEVVLESP